LELFKASFTLTAKIRPIFAVWPIVIGKFRTPSVKQQKLDHVFVHKRLKVRTEPEWVWVWGRKRFLWPYGTYIGLW
jgi:hypothetical protein